MFCDHAVELLFNHLLKSGRVGDYIVEYRIVNLGTKILETVE